MIRNLLVAVCAAFSMLVMAGTAAAQSIDTRAAAVGSVSSFGLSNTKTYGQTFLAPPTPTLVSGFSFQMLSVPNTFTI